MADKGRVENWNSGRKLKTPMQLLQTLNALVSSSGRTDLVERLERYQAIIAKLKVNAQQKVKQEISALTHWSNETKGSAVEEDETPKLSEKMQRKMNDDYYLKLLKDAFPDKGEQEFIQNTLLHTMMLTKHLAHGFTSINRRAIVVNLYLKKSGSIFPYH